jgi:hypothetical protein
MIRFTILITGVIFLFTSGLSAQTTRYKAATVAFYNVENLFDTIDSPDTRDEEFLPDGKYAWTSERYYKKLDKLSEVISQINEEYIEGGPMVLGVSEVENRRVLEDLVKTPRLINSNYGIVHYDSPDERGIDVALLYRKDFFTIIDSSSHPLKFEFDKDDETRAQLLVKAEYDGETFYFMVNHWPSPGGGKKATQPKREAAADQSRELADSILAVNPDAKIIIMGDLNNNPDADAMVKHLKAKKDKDRLKDDEFYNPFYTLHKRGIGSNAYRDAWSLFDQLVLSENLISDDNSSFVYWKAGVFSRKFMIQKDGRFAGYPKRTFSFDRFQNGYSDHFPSYVLLIKRVD